jgi:hypothetical protein
MNETTFTDILMTLLGVTFTALVSVLVWQAIRLHTKQDELATNLIHGLGDISQKINSFKEALVDKIHHLDLRQTHTESVLAERRVSDQAVVVAEELKAEAVRVKAAM